MLPDAFCALCMESELRDRERVRDMLFLPGDPIKRHSASMRGATVAVGESRVGLALTACSWGRHFLYSSSGSQNCIRTPVAVRWSHPWKFLATEIVVGHENGKVSDAISPSTFFFLTPLGSLKSNDDEGTGVYLPNQLTLQRILAGLKLHKELRNLRHSNIQTRLYGRILSLTFPKLSG